jgi:hypothetical protein
LCARSVVNEFLPQHRGCAASTTKPTMAINNQNGQLPGNSTIRHQHHQRHRADNITGWRFYSFLQPVPSGGGFLRTIHSTDPSHLHMASPSTHLSSPSAVQQFLPPSSDLHRSRAGLHIQFNQRLGLGTSSRELRRRTEQERSSEWRDCSSSKGGQSLKGGPHFQGCRHLERAADG